MLLFLTNNNLQQHSARVGITLRNIKDEQKESGLNGRISVSTDLVDNARLFQKGNENVSQFE